MMCAWIWALTRRVHGDYDPMPWVDVDVLPVDTHCYVVTSDEVRIVLPSGDPPLIAIPELLYLQRLEYTAPIHTNMRCAEGGSVTGSQREMSKKKREGGGGGACSDVSTRLLPCTGSTHSATTEGVLESDTPINRGLTRHRALARPLCHTQPYSVAPAEHGGRRA